MVKQVQQLRSFLGFASYCRRFVAAAPLIFTLALPLSLNSLDREGARLLSSCGSQITITPDAGPDDSAPGDAYELKWEFDEDSQ